LKKYQIFFAGPADKRMIYKDFFDVIFLASPTETFLAERLRSAGENVKTGSEFIPFGRCFKFSLLFWR